MNDPNSSTAHSEVYSLLADMSLDMPLSHIKEILRQKILFYCDEDFKTYAWDFTDKQAQDWYEGCYELWYDGKEISPDLSTKFRKPNKGCMYIMSGSTNTIADPSKFSAYAVTAEGVGVTYDITWVSGDYTVVCRGVIDGKPLTREERYGLIMFIFETFELEARARKDWEQHHKWTLIN
jgi:hypothetical protein